MCHQQSPSFLYISYLHVELGCRTGYNFQQTYVRCNFVHPIPIIMSYDGEWRSLVPMCIEGCIFHNIIHNHDFRFPDLRETIKV